MLVVTRELAYETQGDGQVVDITGDVEEIVGSGGVPEGLLTVFVKATTASVAIMELEPGLVLDLKAALRRLFPRDITYQHNAFNNDTNGHSHTGAMFLGPSVTVPVHQGRATLGTYQRIILLDLDSRPRKRPVVVQVLGG